MIWNALMLALREIRRNVLRSFLTILGIVIGVGAVITMVTIGGGATAQVTAQISSLGSNLLMLRPGQQRGMGQRAAAAPFTIRDVEALVRQTNSLSAVAPSASKGMTVVFGNQNWSTTVNGTDNMFFTVRNWSLAKGRKFNDGELRGLPAVQRGLADAGEAVFGGDADEKPVGLFGDVEDQRFDGGDAQAVFRFR